MNFSKYGDYLATGAMDSIVIFWRSHMESTHKYIEEENSFNESDVLSNPCSLNTMNLNYQQNNLNTKNPTLLNDKALNENYEFNSLYNSNQQPNIESNIYLKEDLFEELNCKKISEKTINYKNKNFPSFNYEEQIDTKEHLAENLSKLFEKMVYQLEMVTG